MPILAGPYELLDLKDGQTLDLAIIAFNVGDIEIHPRYAGAPATKLISALRVFVAPGTKPMGPGYWDISAQTLIATIRPLLEAVPGPRILRCRLTAHGVAPAKRYSVEILP